MALFAHHLRQESGALIGWTLVVGVLALGLAAAFAVVPSVGPQAAAAVKNAPAAMQTYIGGPGAFLSVRGWTAGLVLGSLMPLTVAVFVALAAPSLVVEDRADGRLEFLLSLPIRRDHLIVARAASLVVQVAVLEAVLCVATLVGASLIGHSLPVGSVAGAVALGALGQSALAGTLALAALAWRDTSQAMLASLVIALGLYFLPVFVGGGPLRAVSPFAYTDVGVILAGDGPFPYAHAILLAAWAVVSLAIAVLAFARSDA